MASAAACAGYGRAAASRCCDYCLLRPGEPAVSSAGRNAASSSSLTRARTSSWAASRLHRQPSCCRCRPRPPPAVALRVTRRRAGAAPAGCRSCLAGQAAGTPVAGDHGWPSMVRCCAWQASDVNIPGEDVPGYQTIRVGAVEAPVAALADLEAWQAREEFPDIRFSGPVFGVARERSHGGWELYPYFGALAPQAARDSMGSHFRKLAHEAEQSGDQAGRAECLRVSRAARVARSAAPGPGPPRPSGRDPGGPGRAGEVPDRAAGFVIDPVTA